MDFENLANGETPDTVTRLLARGFSAARTRPPMLTAGQRASYGLLETFTRFSCILIIPCILRSGPVDTSVQQDARLGPGHSLTKDLSPTQKGVYVQSRPSVSG
jgi:hypothetical protein